VHPFVTDLKKNQNLKII